MSERTIAVDVSCSCGAFVKGLYSGSDVDFWQENHQHEDPIRTTICIVHNCRNGPEPASSYCIEHTFSNRGGKQ